ncbi:MAG TPA: hypothetical protein VMU57_01605 [Edaphobacter sp.]|uniref:hypothetical protein n=1 Tax=Edaphobacter sp. TaxID=1934404 RepID=UPI002CE60FE8|nr:hypothetical protein [Edaphobacter sp.]HUZ93588.1 hypothetical protein [Edaphobacter sp.]
MTCRNAVSIMALGSLLLCILGCKAAPGPQQIGVFASTSHGLLELTAYGKDDEAEDVYSFRNLSVIPKTSRVEEFYVNMPGSIITETKIFWLASLGKNFDEHNQIPLDANIEAGKGSLYRINVQGLKAKKGGFVLLILPMPLGVSDRAYVLQIPA